MIKLVPDDNHAYYGMACAYASLEQPLLAIEDFSRSIDLDPGNADSLLNRGITHLNQEEDEAAILDLSRVIGLRPGDAAAHLNRGIARACQERYEEAVGDFDRAIALDPEDAEFYYQRGMAASNWAGTAVQSRTWNRPPGWTPSIPSLNPTGKSPPNWPEATAPYSSGAGGVWPHGPSSTTGHGTGVGPHCYSAPSPAPGTMISRPPGIDHASRATCHTSPPVSSAP